RRDLVGALPGARLHGLVGPLRLDGLGVVGALIGVVAAHAVARVLLVLARDLLLGGERRGGRALGVRASAVVRAGGVRPRGVRGAGRHPLVHVGLVEVGPIAAEDLVEQRGGAPDAVARARAGLGRRRAGRAALR